MLSSWTGDPSPFPLCFIPGSVLPPRLAHPLLVLRIAREGIAGGDRAMLSVSIKRSLPLSGLPRYGEEFLCTREYTPVLYPPRRRCTSLLRRSFLTGPRRRSFILENRGNPRQAQRRSRGETARRRGFIGSSGQQISLIACFTRRFLLRPAPNLLLALRKVDPNSILGASLRIRVDLRSLIYARDKRMR